MKIIHIDKRDCSVITIECVDTERNAIEGIEQVSCSKDDFFVLDDVFESLEKASELKEECLKKRIWWLLKRVESRSTMLYPISRTTIDYIIVSFDGEFEQVIDAKKALRE